MINFLSSQATSKPEVQKPGLSEVASCEAVLSIINYFSSQATSGSEVQKPGLSEETRCEAVLSGGDGGENKVVKFVIYLNKI